MQVPHRGFTKGVSLGRLIQLLVEENPNWAPFEEEVPNLINNKGLLADQSLTGRSMCRIENSRPKASSLLASTIPLLCHFSSFSRGKMASR